MPKVLQDRYYTVRDGRYVLPVRSDSHIRVPGIVLGRVHRARRCSSSRATVMSLGNQLKVAMADVEREEARVLAELSDRARARRRCDRSAWDACVEADVLAAIVRLARRDESHRGRSRRRAGVVCGRCGIRCSRSGGEWCQTISRCGAGAFW